MKIATLRRRGDVLPGVSGVARLDRRTVRLATRLNAGDVAVIDHVDLDRITAETLIQAKPVAVVNVQPSISGRYPNLGPELIVDRGILLLDGVGSDVFGTVKEGTKIRLDGDTLYLGEEPIVSGTMQDAASIAELMLGARAGLSAQLEAFAADTAEFLQRQRDLLVDGEGVPELSTSAKGRHVLVVVRGQDCAKQLKALRHYIREFKPVLIGVDGGADALIEAGMRPHVIVGDMEAVSDTALGTGAEVVVHAHADGRAPGLLRVQDLGVDATVFPMAGGSEDAALLLAEKAGAELVVTVGSHADLTDFLDRGREGMASSFLTRLRLGSKVVDARSVTHLYRSRITAAALLLLVIAAFVAIVAALTVSDTGHTYLTSIGDGWDHFVNWVQDSFS
ncbi:putative cytokinetic ring protein SteA [uncultured Jatrophihabitans sp.]|uniref:putative cytokinetic ring protein SteA n=1 Tax=uncultured Jatrophihabitans sp. TaxID=1610747 RepID=UPI0035CAC28B